MRYLVSKEEISSIRYRLDYLYDVFKLYFVKKQEDDKFIVLESFPNGTLDNLMFIIGHDEDVYKYMCKDIKETIIVAITCNCNYLKKFAQNKDIFVAKSQNGIVIKYDGNKWGFNFGITQSEVNLYNNRSKSIVKKYLNL